MSTTYPQNRKLVSLSTTDTIRLPDMADALPRDVRRATIFGYASDIELPGNFHECKISGCHFVGVHFKHTDFLNTIITDTKFENCYFDFGTVSGCALFSCEFTFSKIVGYSFQDTVIDGCLFSSSSIETSMIRHSRIFSNTFSRCLVDNKGFETCLLLENTFKTTDLDFRSIQDNFGLNRDQIDVQCIRVDRTGFGTPKYIDFDGVLENVAYSHFSVLDSFRILYFDISDVDTISSYFPRIFETSSWTDGSIPFGVLPKTLSMFYELLRYEFDHDRLFLYSISRTATLGYEIYLNVENSLSYNEICQAALGVHTQATRLLNCVDNFMSSLPINPIDPYIRFRTDEEASNIDIENSLNLLQNLNIVREWQILERHSPADVLIFLEAEMLASICALFALTRFKLELYKENDTTVDEPKNSQHDDLFENHKQENRNIISRIHFGIPDSVKAHQVMSFASRLPGNVMMTMSLAFSPDQIKRLRRILHTILDSNQEKDG